MWKEQTMTQLRSRVENKPATMSTSRPLKLIEGGKPVLAPAWEFSLSGKEFPLSSTEFLIEVRMGSMDPAVKAAAKALLDARMNPGSLVRITCSGAEEAIKVSETLTRAAVSACLHREEEAISHSREGWPIMELRNGSGIMVVIDKKGSRSHGKG
jgi:hypothetical protein